MESALALGLLDGAECPVHAPNGKTPGRSILFWQKRIWDPDALFSWLAPRLWFFWTRGFVLFSAACILFAYAAWQPAPVHERWPRGGRSSVTAVVSA